MPDDCSGIVADAIGTGIKLSSGTGCACCDDYEQVKVWSSVDQQAMLSQNPGLVDYGTTTLEERKILMANVCPLTPNPYRPDSASSGCRPAASALTLLLSTIYCLSLCSVDTPCSPRELPLHDVYYAQDPFHAHAAISSSLRFDAIRICMPRMDWPSARFLRIFGRFERGSNIETRCLQASSPEFRSRSPALILRG
jgi:hypothetical protein